MGEGERFMIGGGKMDFVKGRWSEPGRWSLFLRTIHLYRTNRQI